MSEKFYELYDLSYEKRTAIIKRWTQDSIPFFHLEIDSLNQCSTTEKLEAIRIIFVVTDFYDSEWIFNMIDRSKPVGKIIEALGISEEEFNEYFGKE